jgi:signal transduction histidine kinase
VRNAKTSADADRHLAAATNLGDVALASIRSICLLLRPSMLDDLGLVPALHWQARETSRRSGIQVKVVAEDADMQLPDDHRTAVYRVVQEALNNAVRHAEATQVQILLREEQGRVLVVIQDDGKGFDPKVARGLGLLGIQERVTHLNGKLQVESAADKGTVLQIELPLDSVPSNVLA